MSVFRFKKFEVRNEKSAMKVNTDGVLLGIAAPVNSSDSNILDIGTGTGTIALILAQRLHDTCGITDNVSIAGIDIDAPAAEEAGINFSNSPWADSLTAKNISLEDFSAETGDRKFDLIVSNPPYYDASLTNPDARKIDMRPVIQRGPDIRIRAPERRRARLDSVAGRPGGGIGKIRENVRIAHLQVIESQDSGAQTAEQDHSFFH